MGGGRGSGPAEPLSPSALRAHLDSLVSGSRRVLLGITGPPGSGKSALAQAIVAHYRHREHAAFASLAPMDGFHLSNAQLKVLGRADRKGAIDTFDVGGYVALLERIRRAGDETVYAPDYDRAFGEPIAARHAIEGAARLVVTEGNYLADPAPGWRRVPDLLDELWMLTGDPEELTRRLVQRHVRHGRNEADAVAWATSVDGTNATRVLASAHRCSRLVDQDALRAFAPSS